MASQILLDKPGLEILDMLSEDPGMWSEAMHTVHAEALERMRSLLPPGKIFARRRTARATNEYLVRAYGLIRDAVQFEVATNLGFLCLPVDLVSAPTTEANFPGDLGHDVRL